MRTLHGPLAAHSSKSYTGTPQGPRPPTPLPSAKDLEGGTKSQPKGRRKVLKKETRRISSPPLSLSPSLLPLLRSDLLELAIWGAALRGSAHALLTHSGSQLSHIPRVFIHQSPFPSACPSFHLFLCSLPSGGATEALGPSGQIAAGTGPLVAAARPRCLRARR